MSWASTPVSTGMSSPRSRRRPTYRTAVPVMNMASVESMNGAPRIAPTPTPCEASEPAPVTMAMIGIIVSGSAVPTAARTEPTAPSASSSLRPNHSIPLVNSSAPARITRNARIRTTTSTSGAHVVGDDDAGRDHHQDGGRDDDHPAVAGPGVADQRRNDPRRRGRDDHDQPEPQEAARPKGQDVGGDLPDVERRRWIERRDPVDQHQGEADREQRDREVGPAAEQAGDRALEARVGSLAPDGAGRRGHEMAFWIISHAVYSRISTKRPRRMR